MLTLHSDGASFLNTAQAALEKEEALNNLMLGVANRIDADYVVTEDKNLIKHTNGICIDVEQALSLVGEANVPSAQPV